MDFRLTEEQQMLKKNIGDFARQELAPFVREIDDKGGFNWDIWRKIADLGLASLAAPEEYGGDGIDDLLTQTLVIEELARYDFSSAANVTSHWSCTHFLSAAGPEMLERYMRPLCTGETVGAFAITEPDSGSDVMSLRTSAVRDGDDYVINGEKCFVTQSGEAAFTIVMARTSQEKGTNGVSALLVDKDAPGLILGQKEDKLGYRGSTTRTVSFSDCRSPVTNIIGEEGKGLKTAMNMLVGGRILTAAQALGQAQGALDASVKHAKERVQFGRNIGSFQLIQGMLADMAIQLESARLLVYYAAWLRDNNLPFTSAAAMAKTMATDTAMKIAVDAVQIYGGYGFMRDYPVEAFMRNVKITQIYEGTNQIQRLLIARELLDSKTSFKDMYGK